MAFGGTFTGLNWFRCCSDVRWTWGREGEWKWKQDVDTCLMNLPESPPVDIKMCVDRRCFNIHSTGCKHSLSPSVNVGWLIWDGWRRVYVWWLQWTFFSLWHLTALRIQHMSHTLTVKSTYAIGKSVSSWQGGRRGAAWRKMMNQRNMLMMMKSLRMETVWSCVRQYMNTVHVVRTVYSTTVVVVLVVGCHIVVLLTVA